MREPEGWLAPDASVYVQFRSLANHLLALYPVPNFMVRIWFEIGSKEWERHLYLHLAQGLSVRKFRMPFPWQMGKCAARYFMQAPDDLHPIMALRWARVLSLGGDDLLARTLLKTVLVAPHDDEHFWDTVVRFLIANAPLSVSEVRDVIDFIHGQKCRPAEAVLGRGAGQRPLQPDFSLERFTLSRLRRHMIHWRAERMASLPTVASSSESPWTASPIGSFRDQAENETWTIHEILTSQELRAEGGIMQHCVASYIHACARRKTSIWSMQVQKGDTRQRVLTIEVKPEERIIRQAKGKKNAPPSEVAERMLQRWAAQEGLLLRQS